MAMLLEQMKSQLNPLGQRLITSFLQGSDSVILPEIYFVDANALMGYTYSEVSDLGSVSERAINAAYTDGDSKAAPKHITCMLFGGSAKTDAVYIDEFGDAARLKRINQRMIASGKKFDDLFINGDSSANAKQINGLRKMSELRAKITYAGDNGAALTLDMLDETMDAVAGDNSKKVILCDRWTRRKISKLVKASAGGKGVQDSQIQLATYNSARILTMVENASLSAIFSTTETRGNNADCRSLYVVRFGGAGDEEFVQGIRGKTWMKLRSPVNGGEYIRDVIDNVMGWESFGQYGFQRLAGIRDV